MRRPKKRRQHRFVQFSFSHFEIHFFCVRRVEDGKLISNANTNDQRRSVSFLFTFACSPSHENGRHKYNKLLVMLIFYAMITDIRFGIFHWFYFPSLSFLFIRFRFQTAARNISKCSEEKKNWNRKRPLQTDLTVVDRRHTFQLFPLRFFVCRYVATSTVDNDTNA